LALHLSISSLLPRNPSTSSQRLSLDFGGKTPLREPVLPTLPRKGRLLDQNPLAREPGRAHSAALCRGYGPVRAVPLPGRTPLSESVTKTRHFLTVGGAGTAGPIPTPHPLSYFGCENLAPSRGADCWLHTARSAQSAEPWEHLIPCTGQDGLPSAACSHLFHPRPARAWLPDPRASGQAGQLRLRRGRDAGLLVARTTRPPKSSPRTSAPRAGAQVTGLGRRCCRRSASEAPPAELRTVPATAAAGDAETAPGRGGRHERGRARSRFPAGAPPQRRRYWPEGDERARTHGLRGRARDARRVMMPASRPCGPCVASDWRIYDQ
jgi:hypothetical protein